MKSLCPHLATHHFKLSLSAEIRVFDIAYSSFLRLHDVKHFKALKISSLERRPLERDLTLCYSLFHGICDIHLPLKLGVSVTGGNSCKLVKTSCNTNTAKYFYTNRIVLTWNSLSDTVVTASSVNAFRKQLNAANLEKFLTVG